MEKITLENFNPQLDRIGDCVLRAITAFEYYEMYNLGACDLSTYDTYNRIKDEIESHGPYDRQINFEKYLSNHGYVRINAYKWIDNIRVRSANQLAIFCKNFNISALALSNTHMAYVDPKKGVVDTWDSRRKHLEVFYIKEEDVHKLDLKMKEEIDRFTNIKYVDTKENVIKMNKVNDKSYKQIRK
ncbi:hypothetical protein [Enterococcus phage VPE25]|nr:hypothetical protein [Enterococcus phage VPE25]SCZ84049.1 hypothetical protein [Enterococcus phage VFW]